MLDPIQSCADVILFAVAVVVNTLAEAYTAKVESQDGKAEGREGLHGVVDDFIVHGAAAGGVWVADQCGERGGLVAGIEEGLKAASGAAKIVDRSYLEGSSLRHLLQFIGCARYPFFMDDAVCWRTWR